MRFILLELDRIVKTPREVEVIRTNRPRGFEKIMFIASRKIKVNIVRVLYFILFMFFANILDIFIPIMKESNPEMMIVIIIIIKF